MQLFGIRLLGVDAHNGHKLLFTAVFFALLYGISKGLRSVFYTDYDKDRYVLDAAGHQPGDVLLGVLGFVSIWFDNPARLATGIGLVGAGLAFALQKVITNFAGYFVILRGKTF